MRCAAVAQGPRSCAARAVRGRVRPEKPPARGAVPAVRMPSSVAAANERVALMVPLMYPHGDWLVAVTNSHWNTSASPSASDTQDQPIQPHIAGCAPQAGEQHDASGARGRDELRAPTRPPGDRALQREFRLAPRIEDAPVAADCPFGRALPRLVNRLDQVVAGSLTPPARVANSRIKRASLTRPGRPGPRVRPFDGQPVSPIQTSLPGKPARNSW